MDNVENYSHRHYNGNTAVNNGAEHTTMTPLAVDATPSDGSNALNHTRQFETMRPDLDFKAAGNGGTAQIGVDVTPSTGSIELNGNRDHERMAAGSDWKSGAAGAGTRQLQPNDMSPSGSSELYGALLSLSLPGSHPLSNQL
jgi:hypothetical protein